MVGRFEPRNGTYAVEAASAGKNPGEVAEAALSAAYLAAGASRWDELGNPRSEEEATNWARDYIA